MAAIPDGNGLGGADGRRPRNRLRSKSRLCGICGVSWNACACREADRTETLGSILANCRGLDQPHSQHLCFFIYFSYRRWSAPLQDEYFSACCLPSFEGWYAAWIVPSSSAARKVSGFEDAVLEVVVNFHDGSAMNGFITRVGDLVLVNPASSPRHGVFLDPMVAALQMDTMPVARMFTLQEMESGDRGFVHGSIVGENNLRKVSHIVRDDGAGSFIMLKYPEKDYDSVEFATVPRENVRDIVPGYVEEYRLRSRRRFTKTVANSMQPYLESFCERAKAADIAQREARSPTLQLDTPQKLVDDVLSSLSALKMVMDAPARKKKATPGISIPKSAPAPTSS